MQACWDNERIINEKNEKNYIFTPLCGFLNVLCCTFSDGWVVRFCPYENRDVSDELIMNVWLEGSSAGVEASIACSTPSSHLRNREEHSWEI